MHIAVERTIAHSLLQWQITILLKEKLPLSPRFSDSYFGQVLSQPALTPLQFRSTHHSLLYNQAQVSLKFLLVFLLFLSSDFSCLSYLPFSVSPSQVKPSFSVPSFLSSHFWFPLSYCSFLSGHSSLLFGNFLFFSCRLLVSDQSQGSTQVQVSLKSLVISLISLIVYYDSLIASLESLIVSLESTLLSLESLFISSHFSFVSSHFSFLHCKSFTQV